jgi:RES domain-containing protein
MHSTAILRRLIKTVPVVSLDESLYRVVRADVLYGFFKDGPHTPRPLHSLGPPRGGARFTPRGGVPSLYLAGDMETAMREYLQIASPQSLRPLQPAGALVTYSAKVSLASVLDLTSPTIQRRLGTSKKELAEPWRYRRDRRKPPAQILGAVAAKDGRIQAIRYHSTKGPGDCLVIFTESLEPPTFVEVFDPDDNLVERIP